MGGYNEALLMMNEMLEVPDFSLTNHKQGGEEMRYQYLHNWEIEANILRPDPIFETLLGSISYHIFNDIFPDYGSKASPQSAKNCTIQTPEKYNINLIECKSSPLKEITPKNKSISKPSPTKSHHKTSSFKPPQQDENYVKNIISTLDLEALAILKPRGKPLNSSPNNHLKVNNPD